MDHQPALGCCKVLQKVSHTADAAAKQPEQASGSQKTGTALPSERSSADSGAKVQPLSQAAKPPLDRKRSEDIQSNLKPTPEQAMLANGHSQGLVLLPCPSAPTATQQHKWHALSWRSP